MRTCVLLSGKPNDIYNYYDSKMVDYSYYCENIYKSIIEPFDADVFISTWDFDGIDNMIEYYNPKLIRDIASNILENDITDTDNQNWSICNVDILKNHQYPMYYKIYDCNELKKEYELLNNFKYDLVIRSRLDLKFGDKHESVSIEPYLTIMDKDEIKDVINNDVLYLRKDPYKFANRKIDNWIWDQFAFSNSGIMDIYCSTYLNIHNIVNSGAEYAHLAEKLLYYNLENNNVKTKHTHLVYGIKC